MWNLLNNNYSCAEKETLKSYQKLFIRLLSAKSKINNKANETPFFLINKSSLKEFKRDEERKITKINNLLNTKIQHVMNSPSKYSQRVNSPKYCPALDKQRYNYSRIEKERNIFSENKSLFQRFTQRKPTYSTKNLLRKYDYEQYIKNNISKSKFLPKVPLKLRTFGNFKFNLIKESTNYYNNLENLNNTNISENSNNNRFRRNLDMENINLQNFSFCNDINNNNCFSPKNFFKNIRYKIDKINSKIIE